MFKSHEGVTSCEMLKVQLRKLLGDFKMLIKLFRLCSQAWAALFLSKSPEYCAVPTGWSFEYFYSIKQLSIQPGGSCKLFFLIEVMLDEYVVCASAVELRALF